MAWIEEYKHCSCTFIAEKEEELPGHCSKHGNPRKYKIKIPKVKKEDLGYTGVG
jgi:hypothetical protein